MIWILPVRLNHEYSYYKIFKLVDECIRDEKIVKFSIIHTKKSLTDIETFYSTINGVDYDPMIEEFYISVKVDENYAHYKMIEKAIPNILIRDEGLILAGFHCIVRSER